MKKKILFLTILSNKVGIGHYKRTSLLSESFNKLNYQTLILIISDTKIKKKQKNEKYFNLRNKSFLKEKSITNFINNTDFFFCDASNIKIIRDVQRLINILKKNFPKKTKKIIYPSSLYNEILINKNVNFFSTLIWPYATEKLIRKKQYKNIKYLVGTKYFIFNKNLKQKTKKPSEKLLITCGGSDPYKYSLKIIDIIEEFKKIISINFIIGEQYSSSLKSKILKKISNSKHNYKIIFSPKNLNKIINNSGYAISTSGLTKYELFFSRTPSIIISISKYDNILNKNFIQISKFLDVSFNLNKIDLLNKLFIMINDKDYAKNIYKSSLKLNLSAFELILKSTINYN